MEAICPHLGDLMRRFLCLLTALMAQGLHTPSSRAAEKPNFVFITCEDISPNLGCYADPDAITPNLDRLAAQGARFTRASRTPGLRSDADPASSPACTPRRWGATTCGRS